MDFSVNSNSDQTIESLLFAHDLGKDSVRLENIDGHPVYIGPKDLIKEDLEKFARAPYRIREHRKFTDVSSFGGYTRAFNTGEARFFGSIGQRNVTAILDYHDCENPSWTTHKAELVSLVTPEWAEFKKSNERPMGQQEFAEFLERWTHVISKPDAAHISEIALNLEGAVGCKFASKINRHNGSATFRYEEETVTSEVKVPTKFEIQVAPFYYSPLLTVEVLLRFRVTDGAPKFHYVIQNPETIEYNALVELFQAVENETGQQVLVGP